MNCKIKLPFGHGVILATVGIYVATTIEKFFVDSDDGLCIKKNREIQWNETFLI